MRLQSIYEAVLDFTKMSRVFIKGDLFGYTCGGRWIVLSETLNKIETQIHVERFLFNNARVTPQRCHRIVRW